VWTSSTKNTVSNKPPYPEQRTTDTKPFPAMGVVFCNALGYQISRLFLGFLFKNRGFSAIIKPVLECYFLNE